MNPLLFKAAAIVIAAVCFCSSAAAQDDDVIAVDSSIVVMNAVVRDAQDRAVLGLQRSHFSIFEDGVEQAIAAFESHEAPFAAVILLDTSGSMQSRISAARSAAINFLDGLRPGDVAAVYRFDSRVTEVQEFSGSRDVSERIFGIRAEGMTVLNDAIVEAAAKLAARPEARRAIIVVSDGADTRSGNSADKAIKAALAANATIYTVDMSELSSGGPARMQNRGVLKNFADKTGGFFVSSDDALKLRTALRSIVEELRNQYTLAYSPEEPKYDGRWHALELRVARPGLTIRTRKGYNAPKKK
ncbi:MAG: VWA domain-containing protein [Pyrinomonadaceae bacterium]